MGADKHAVRGASDVDLDAVRAIAQGAFDSGEGVLRMGWAGGTAVSEDEHTATVARRCVLLPSSTRPQCERVEHSLSDQSSVPLPDPLTLCQIASLSLFSSIWCCLPSGYRADTAANLAVVDFVAVPAVSGQPCAAQRLLGRWGGVIWVARWLGLR